MTIGPEHYAILGTLVFAIGLFGVCTRRHPLAILLALATTFVGPLLAFAGFDLSGGGTTPPLGSAIGLFLLVIMSLEVITGVGVTLVLWRQSDTTDIDDLDLVEG